MTDTIHAAEQLVLAIVALWMSSRRSPSRLVWYLMKGRRREVAQDQTFPGRSGSE